MFRILVVDDSAADVYLLQKALQRLQRPSHIDWVQNGDEALDFLHTRGLHTNALRPNLILMDLHMPGINGLETLAAIKGDVSLALIPVIMLSTAAFSEAILESYRLQASGFVQKPSSWEASEEFAQAVEKFWMTFVISAPIDAVISTTSTLKPRPASNVTDPYTDRHGRPIAGRQPEASYSAMIEERDRRASVQEQPGVAGCPERRQLLDEFGVATQVLLQLHEQQFEAIADGDPECNRFDLLIHMANEKKQQAKYSYIRHMESHECSSS